MSDPQEQVYARVRAALPLEIEPVRPERGPAARAGMMGLAFVAWMAVALWMMGAVGAHRLSTVQWAGVSTVLALGAGVLAMSLAWQVSPGSLRRIPAGASIAVAAMAMLLAEGILFPWDLSASTVRQGLACLGVGAMVAAPAALLFLWMVRRSEWIGSPVLGATAGALAGWVGVAMLHFHCGILEASHIAVWHGGVLLVSTVVGAFAGRLARA